MNNRLQILILLSLSGLLLALPVFAQDNEPALPSATGAGETVPEEETPAAQEVEISEDNYRQFMELKDAMRQRDVIPENVFKPGSGLQKLDSLPEESQKHLRNQLREIIVQGDEWQPGDEETEYPYTPSPAAGTNPALEKQELEAWGELVDSYHERESQIYENSSGMQTARGSEQGSSNSQQNGAGSGERQGQNGEGSEGQQAGQQGNPNQADTEGTYSLNGSADSSADSTAGVSQNAMEFLRGLGQGGSPGESAQNDRQAESPESTSGATQNAMEFLQGSTGQAEGLADSGTGQDGGSGESNPASSESAQGQGESDGGAQGETQAMAQETGSQADTKGAGQEGEQADSQEGEQAQDSQLAESSDSSVTISQPGNNILDSPNQPEEESTAGASQNALEYLTGEDPRAEAGEDQPEGTLSIQDLLNAQGIGESTNVAPMTTGSGDEGQADEGQADEDKPEKDGGGR